MNQCRVVITLLLFMKFSYAQNLISNPGFENFSALPTTYGEFNLAIGWDNCSGGGTPDYFHTLGTVGTYFGTNLPHTGDAMAGFCPYHGSQIGFREYLSTQLSSPLVVGQTYAVSFWLASGINGGYGYGCNNIGVLFSSGPLTQPGSSYIPDTPQVEITSIYYDTAWTQFSFQYTATGPFDYFTIGNFRDDANTSIAQFGIAYNAVYYFLDDISVELSNLPPVALFNAPNHICPGTCTGFNNMSLNATSYLWTFTGATPSTSTDASPVNICYNTPGSYTVSLIATNAITSDTLTLNNYITVYPYPAPQGILQSGDTLFANQGAVSYQWYFNGSLINGATNYFHLALQSGDYNVVCTDANGCEVEAVIFNVIASVSPLSHAWEEKILVYPNPASGFLLLRSPFSITGITIYNSAGEKIRTIGGNKNEAEWNGLDGIEIDISGCAPGVYSIEAAAGNEIFRTYFVKY